MRLLVVPSAFTRGPTPAHTCLCTADDIATLFTRPWPQQPAVLEQTPAAPQTRFAMAESQAKRAKAAVAQATCTAPVNIAVIKYCKFCSCEDYLLGWPAFSHPAFCQNSRLSHSSASNRSPPYACISTKGVSFVPLTNTSLASGIQGASETTNYCCPSTRHLVAPSHRTRWAVFTAFHWLLGFDSSRTVTHTIASIAAIPPSPRHFSCSCTLVRPWLPAQTLKRIRSGSTESGSCQAARLALPTHTRLALASFLPSVCTFQPDYSGLAMSPYL